MKIFQLIQKPQARGAELFADLLSDQLQKQGHEVFLVSVFEGDFKLSFSGTQVHLKRSLKNRLWDWKGWKDFSELVKKEQPDIIQANAGDTLKFAVMSKAFFGWKAPIVFRNASLVSRYIQNPIVKSYNSWLYSLVGGIVSVSEESQKDFNSVFSPKNKLHRAIPIGIPISEHSPKLVKSSDPILVHIGGFTFEKNHLGLLKIFREVLKSQPAVKLWLFGDGPLLAEVLNQIRLTGLEGNVIWKGVQSDPFSLIPETAILILPSIIEGLPSVILEAFAARIPVIAFGVGGIPEVVKSGETGWLVQVGESAAFGQAILECLSLPDQARNKLTDSAKELVEEKYQICRIAEEFEGFYRELLNP